MGHGLMAQANDMTNSRCQKLLSLEMDIKAKKYLFGVRIVISDNVGH